MGRGSDSVGSLLAEIANLLMEGLRIFSLADKRHWGPDEHAQHQALEEALNEAKGDFQELCPLVNGQAQYEHDRNFETIQELKPLRAELQAHILSLKDWIRSGGPIDPTWVRETQGLQRKIHRAQCRAARRVFTSSQESSQRCLGAFIVRRAQRRIASSQPPRGLIDKEIEKRQLAEVGVCTKIGSFNRFGDQDMAFICDFCDGHLIWSDLDTVPTERSTPYLPSSKPNDPHWQATGSPMSTSEQKQVIFAPVAVANHVAPLHGDWQARLYCPYCEEQAHQPQDEDDEEDLYRPNEEFEDVTALQEHLAWHHPGTLARTTTTGVLPARDSCLVM